MNKVELTIFDGINLPRTVELDASNKRIFYFGREEENDIVLSSRLVSSQHGRIVLKGERWIIEDKASYRERGSRNGLIYNGLSIVSHVISDGDFIRIDDGIETISLGVLFVFSLVGKGNQWNTISLLNKREITIGRDNGCDIVLPYASASKVHGRIIKQNAKYFIIDNDSTNGIIINDKRIAGRQELHEKDVIHIANAKIIFTSNQISYCLHEKGVSLCLEDIVVNRSGSKRKPIITCNHVSLNINPGELIGIVGGSGAGKSTILNCMSGYLKPSSGKVYINGIDLYKNYEDIKQTIGYVPQSDIVYGNLSLKDMLMYSAKLRLPGDTSKAELRRAVQKVIDIVELGGMENNLIRRLSGGQRKRASIAVELLSDPNLLFLDEPASGLDPGTERSLMNALREMANHGKTVILITHSTLQLEMCDRIVFMGRGGNLCYFGGVSQAREYFGIDDIVDVYSIINEYSGEYKEKYIEMTASDKVVDHPVAEGTELIRKHGHKFQIVTLCKRYMKLMVNDRVKLMSLLLQAPLLIFLISFVADGEQFAQYEMTKSLLFVLACSGFWIGMLNAIQEICKEREIVKREYMTGLSMGEYILSKAVVLSLIGIIQSILLVGGFQVLVGMPESGVGIYPVIEILITTILTVIASIALGLFISSLVSNADRAMVYVPIFLMAQILFSGLIFKMDGIVKLLSWFTTCRWSMEGYGTTANLNSLELRLQQEGVLLPHQAEFDFDFTTEHLVYAWEMLILFAIVFAIMTRFSMEAIKKEKA